MVYRCVMCVEVNVMKVGHGKTRCTAPVTPFLQCQVAVCKWGWGQTPSHLSPPFPSLRVPFGGTSLCFVTFISALSPWNWIAKLHRTIQYTKIAKISHHGNWTLHSLQAGNVPLNLQVKLNNYPNFFGICNFKTMFLFLGPGFESFLMRMIDCSILSCLLNIHCTYGTDRT